MLGNLRIWQRLLWKEYCESWPILLIGIAIPLAIIPLHPKDPDSGTATIFAVKDLMYVGIGLISLLVTLWAVQRVHNTGPGQMKTRNAFPISPVTQWITAFLLPIAIPVLTGLSVGIMLWSLNQNYFPLSGTLTYGMLFLLAGFAMTTTFTLALSAIPAIMLGVIWVFYGFDTLANNSQLSIAVIAGSLLASVIWDPLARRQRYLPGKVCAVVVLLGISAVPVMMKRESPSPMVREDYWSINQLTSYTSRDHSLVTFSMNPDRLNMNKDRFEYAFYDLRENRRQEKRFQYETYPFGFIGRTQVVLGQDRPQERWISILIWDTRSRQVRTVTRIPAKRSKGHRLCTAQMSPDSRYLFVIVRSQIGPGDDLWMVDLTSPKARLIYPGAAINFSYDSPTISWQKEYAFIFGMMEPCLCVDLHTLRVTPFNLAEMRKVAR